MLKNSLFEKGVFGVYKNNQMKKILLTLITVAAVFVACDKDGLETELSPNAIIEQAEEINASIDQTSMNERAIEILNTFSGRVSTKGVSNLTSRSTTIDYAGLGSVQIGFFVQDGNNYAHIRSEEFANACFADASFNAVYTFVDATTINVDYVDPAFNDFTYNPEGDHDAVVSVFQLDSYLSTLQLSAAGTYVDGGAFWLGETEHAGTFDFTCTGTPQASAWIPSAPDANGIITVTHATLGSYTLQAAPFPLTGWLSTQGPKTGDAASRTVRNYAGTASNTVMSEIQDDYEGN